MLTAKKIEEILGLSARTIETWSRTRDEKYLLVQLLKSFSEYELKHKINGILDNSGFVIKKHDALLEDIGKELNLLLPDINNPKVLNLTKEHLSDSVSIADMYVLDNSTLYIVELLSQLPSKGNLDTRCEKIKKVIRSKDQGEFKNIKYIQFMYITRRTNGKYGEKMQLENNEIILFDIESVALKLYGKKVIVLN